MARTEVLRAVVCDAGPIIHLDELAQLALLSDFVQVLVPDAVWEEVLRHRPAALTSTDVALTRVVVPAEDDPGFAALVQTLALDAGEREALILARRHPGHMLLTDDAAARMAAQGMGLPVHGTLGILIRAARRGQRMPDEILAVLQDVPRRSTLFIRTQLLAEIIHRFKTEYGL